MTRLHRFAALLLLLALVGCTVERRPPETDEADSASEAPADTTGVADARTFLDRLQEARRAGRVTFVRERLHPEALLVRGDRRIDGAAPTRPDEVESLVAPAAGVEGWEASGREIDGAVVFVLRYPAAFPDGRRPLETLVLARDSARWQIRLLVRAFDGSDPPDS